MGLEVVREETKVMVYTGDGAWRFSLQYGATDDNITDAFCALNHEDHVHALETSGGYTLAIRDEDAGLMLVSAVNKGKGSGDELWLLVADLQGNLLAKVNLMAAAEQEG